MLMAINRNNEYLSSAACVSLTGCRALVTGAASGIGEAICCRFARSGADLLMIDINQKGLEKVKASLSSCEVEIETHVLDLSRKAAIDDFWESRKNHKPNILVNNSGIYPAKRYLDVDQEFYQQILNVNLSSAFWMCQDFIKARENRGGIIVNVSSIEAVTPFKEDMVHYSVSKSGVYALTRSLAHDYGKRGFRVNGIVPGVIKTPGIYQQAKAALKKLNLGLLKSGFKYKSRLAVGRLGQPDEIAKVVLFLCSDLASYVQGAMIPVDGGFLSS